jgi:5-methylcytosine-specific restriction endonuclease McrA
MANEKACSKCKIYKSLLEFYLDKSKPSGLGAYCKECTHARRRKGPGRNNKRGMSVEEKRLKSNRASSEWKKRNREYVNAKMRERRQADPAKYAKIKKRSNDKRRAQKLSSVGVLPVDYENIIFSLYGRVCLKCRSDRNIEMDHVIPLSTGGIHCITNMQPLCRSCNASKGNRSSDDYRTYDIMLKGGLI